MPDSSYDCIVIGSGPGGYVAAIRAAQLGMKTAVIERDVVGGRCLNYACIPAKAVLRVADVLAEIDEADDFGISVPERSVDFSKVMARREKVISTLTGGVAGLFKKNKIEYIEGLGSVTDDGNVKVGGNFDGTEIEAKTVILATGSVPKPLPGTEFGGRVIGTEEAWALEALPETMAVAGAGASGVEIASAYGRLGTSVMLFEALDRVVPAEDADISKLVGRGLSKQNIKIHTGKKVENVKTSDDKVSFSFGDESAEVDWFVIAAGRGPDVEGLGLDEAGVKLDDRGMIAVDGALRTSLKGVYAIGDLVPGPALAHKASDEGIIAVEDAAGMETHPIEYIDIPRATFCTPNVGSFGLTEEQAREQGFDVTVGKVNYGAVGAGTVYGDRGGMIKIIGEKKYGELIGGHIVGARATELIQELVNARALEGGYHEVARIVHGHPTLSEAVMEAARAADGWLIHGEMAGAPPEQAIFYYDLSSPEAYLVAERSTGVLGEVPEWQPVWLGGLRAGEVGPFRCAAEIDAYREDIARRAAAYGLQPLRWPPGFPPDAEWAMLVATYAKQIGRAVAFSLAAFRQSYAGGRDLGDPDTVMLAAAACEMHPVAVEKGARLGSIRRRLDEATAAAAAAGVLDVPAVRIGDRVFHGDRELEAAAAALGGGSMKANREYELHVRRGGRGPAMLAGPDRIDHIEVVEIATGEVALFWDTRPAQTRRLANGLRADLAQLEADVFIAKWRRWQVA